MALIPDYSKEPFFDRDGVQANKAAIETEVKQANTIALQNAWNDLQSTPSYVERYAASPNVTE